MLPVLGPLWALTMAGAPFPWYVGTAFWLGLGGVLWPWIYFSELPKEKTRLRHYEEAMQRNQAHEIRIQSDEMVEFEEQEDEGVCYAFQLPGRRIVFITGQEYYPSAKFPNSDFSLVQIYGQNGFLLEEFKEKHGRKIKPKRTISPKLKWELRIPNNLEVIEGELDELERLLALRADKELQL